MFRDYPKTKMNPEVAGVGSVVSDGHDNPEHSWLIVGGQTGTCVALVNAKTMQMASCWVDCENIHYLSSNECRELCRQIGNELHWTFTDFFWSSEGMKGRAFASPNAG